MIERRVYIRAAATFVPAQFECEQRRPLAQDPNTDLSIVAKRVLGQRLRQASHFVELATIGARLCLAKIESPASPDMAVYVGTGLGELRKNEALFHQVFPPGSGAAAPFDFINATANMAAFYVARMAGASARNLTVTQGRASFENALRLALDDLQSGAVSTALVGGVDENCFPRETYVHRWPLRDGEIMGEGSAWLLLSSDPAHAIAELFAVELGHEPLQAPDLTNAIGKIAPDAAALVCGSMLDAADRAALASAFPHAELISYIEYCGSYPTASGYGIAAGLEGALTRGSWLHVNRDTNGRVMMVGWRGLEN